MINFCKIIVDEMLVLLEVQTFRMYRGVISVLVGKWNW